MLAAETLVAFVPSTDMDRARRFYEGVLGLSVESVDQFAMVLDANGVMVRVANVAGVPGFKPAPFTVLGWRVSDIADVIDRLGARGVKFERYPGMQQDDRGVWTSPSGAMIAWFKDPEGNVLSVTQ